MNISSIIINRGVLVCLVVMSLCISNLAAAKKDALPEISHDGLTLKRSTKLTTVYVKTGADFTGYDKIQLLPCRIAFKKNWARDYNRDQRSLSTYISEKDIVRIKKELSTLFDQIFIEEFGRKNGYPLVTEAARGVLQVRPAIIDLDVNAPDVDRFAPSKIYVRSAGEGTLYLELYDAVSGEIIARVTDRRKAPDKDFYTWSSRISNRVEAKRIIKSWAKQFRTHFDAARNPSK